VADHREAVLPLLDPVRASVGSHRFPRALGLNPTHFDLALVLSRADVSLCHDTSLGSRHQLALWTGFRTRPLNLFLVP